MRSQRLAFYLARDGELDPASLVAIAATAGKTPLLPVLHPLNHRQLYFLPFQSGQPLVRNRFGIPEPDLKGARPVSPLTIDVIFLPLVAFDSFGNRLGMGGGFYDRTLAGLPRQRRHPLLIGVAHSFQLVDSLPREPWDIPLHGIATEQGMVWPTGTSA